MEKVIGLGEKKSDWVNYSIGLGEKNEKHLKSLTNIGGISIIYSIGLGDWVIFFFFPFFYFRVFLKHTFHPVHLVFFIND